MWKTWITKYGRNRLAKELGIDRSTVHYWIHGKNFPDIDNLRGIVKLAKADLGRREFGEFLDSLSYDTFFGSRKEE